MIDDDIISIADNERDILDELLLRIDTRVNHIDGMLEQNDFPLGRE